MKREIKFRAWSESANRYSKPFTIHSDVLNFTDDDGLGVVKTLTSEIVEQYAGLKDKNGVEIYEGDIVNDKIKGFDIRKSVVQWDLVNPCFVLKRIDNKYNHIDYEYDFVKCDLMTIEVIGNIHENK
tara:strand:+ start:72 stop:452 length:381 start_codon:yes stop_codon:yes gene_type:complete